MSQPTPEIDDTPRLASEYRYLLVAIVTAIAAIGIWAIQRHAPIAPNTADEFGDIRNVLHVIAGAAFGGYLIRSAEGRVERRVDRRGQELDEARKEGYAAGYLDCANERAAVNGHGATIHSLH